MRCLNPPLPSSLHPTPPHTWDGHFISECSKWKGDLNLPCFPLTPSLSPSPTRRASYCWWTAHCWLPKPAASALNLVREYWIHIGLLPWKDSLHFKSLFLFILLYFLVCDPEVLTGKSSWQLTLVKVFRHDLFNTQHRSVLLAHYSVLGLSHCC